ncbi:unnamed protein product [Periconia digitata]|uniref:HTH myb-type domain-containing protein n=1 Tax=Periconia digitata TaxID=1303443 RepID=A0A9W4XJ34_9PLEO|nr:unnamed protein product [Periconia digitata]
MSSSRYPDNRYARDRSPYRDRRPSTYGNGYPPRLNDPPPRPNGDQGNFPPRDPPRGPKSHADPPRGPVAGGPQGAPSAPRDARGRGGFAGRGEAPSLRDAPPLSSVSHSHNSWRADRDRDRDFERDRRERERRPSPPRRSPLRDTRDNRDNRDPRDFPPRDLDINRARRNSREGPPSAGSTYSDPPLGNGSSYRGSGIGRGRGGRDFHTDMRGRGRNFHADDRHHDVRDRVPDRMQDRSYRPRSRSRDPVRRERDVRDVRDARDPRDARDTRDPRDARDIRDVRDVRDNRDDRDFDRRDREDRQERRFVPREYDSYIGPAGGGKPGPRGLDTHRGSVALEPRHLPGTPTSATPHTTHSPADRLGSLDSFVRRASMASESLATKREPTKDDSLLASRAEASKERYAPRASSPPAAVPAFGFSSNVWRNPALDAKPSAPPIPKPASSSTTASSAPASTAPVPPNPTVSAGPKTSIPPGLSTAPPTGPKADRVLERPQGDAHNQHSAQESRPIPSEQTRSESRPQIPQSVQAHHPPAAEGHERQEPKPALPGPNNPSLPPTNSPHPNSVARNRPPPTGPQATLRANVSPSFPRPAHLPFASRDASRDSSPSAIPPQLGPRNGNTGSNASSANTSPRALPANIPTGPKAARAGPMSARPSSMYPPSDRQGFAPPRIPIGSAPKSMQWVRPGLTMNNRPSIPAKREYPSEDRDRSFGNAPKAPKLDNGALVADPPRHDASKSTSPSSVRQTAEGEFNGEKASPIENRKEAPSNLGPLHVRHKSDVMMTDASPRTEKPPMSAASSAPEALQDSDDDLDLDDADFAESEAKYNREKALLEAKRINLNVAHLRATTPLSEIMLLASLSIEHLPRQETKSVDGDTASIPPADRSAESITAELPTPKAEDDNVDVVMEDKETKQLAPATRALRLRHGDSDDTEEEPDFSSLPYLGSGPPTPISELEGPRVNESLMLAIRDRLKKTIEPELSPEETLQQYANVYREWRLKIRDLDDARDLDDPERPPSAEPSVRVTTPDVTSAAMGPLLDLPPTTTGGRRGHSSRWATELDLETAIKESLKTAEEERMGKKEREPTKSMADPEKEATLPTQLTTYEVQRRRFIDTNFQREPGQGLFVYHYEPPEDDFTEEEHRIMVHQYRDQYSKKWGKLAEMLYKEAGTSRTYKDCINHYYATKWGREYKGKLKRGRGKKRGGGGAGRRGAISNMGDRPDPSGDDGLPPALTETGRPRRSAAPTFGGTETDLDTTTSTPTSGRRRANDGEGTHEKVGRKKGSKEKAGRKPKAQPLVPAPVGSPVKIDRKLMDVKMEDELQRHPLGEMPLPMQPALEDAAMNLVNEPQFHSGQTVSISERPRVQASSRPGPSSYWSVTEQNDFRQNVAHFGTDWAAIALHMGTKTQTMVKNQYLRLVESRQVPELERLANEADARRARGEDLGPPPTPSQAPKRRYESTQAAAPRTLAPTPEATIPPTMALPKASPPGSASSRYSTIAQAPQEVKPAVAATGYTNPEPGTPSLPSVPPPQQQGRPSLTQQQHQILEQPQPSPHSQQSPQAQPARGPQHQFQHVSQPETRRAPPPVGYFSQDFPPRRDPRPTSQSSNATQNVRPLQPQIQSQLRAHEPSQTPFFRPATLQERDSASRAEQQQQSQLQPQLTPQQQQQQQQQHHQQQQQENEARMRYHGQHARRISGEVSTVHGRHPPTSAVSQMQTPQMASSPEHRPVPLQHRAIPQQQSEASVQPSISMPPAQYMQSRSAVATPPLKEEPRSYPVPHGSQNQQPLPPPTPAQGYAPLGQPPTQAAPPPPPPAPKPAAEPRKSNLLSLLNDPEPEEPKRKKPVEQNLPSHTPTPQQQVPIVPPPVSQALAPQRDQYRDPSSSQPPFGRSSYAPQSALPQMSSGRQVVDLTNEQASASRGLPRESWRQSLSAQSQHQQVPAHNSPHAGLAQLANHRSVFAQHNNSRYNPSPPPLATYNNSPHLHSRTPSLSGAPTQPPRHTMTASTSAPHAQGATSQILKPNPYAQVDPPGPGVQPSGPVGMQPSPHLHMSHAASQRELHSRNEHSRNHNAAMGYSNSPTPNEHHPMPQHMRAPSMADQFRGRDPRDPRDVHDFDARNPERDMSRELAHRGDALRETYLSRSTGPPQSHIDSRYQAPQDRGFAPQRTQTPISRSEHGPPLPLQHPPHSSLGDSNHALYGQRQEESLPRFRDAYPIDPRVSERMREEQAQQHPASRDDPYARERDMREREMRDREMRDREMRDREMQEAQYQNMMRRPGAPPQGHDQRGGPPAQPMEWARHPPPHQQQQDPRWGR